MSGVPNRDHLNGKHVRVILHPHAPQNQPTEGIFRGQGERGFKIEIEGGGLYPYQHNEVARIEATEEPTVPPAEVLAAALREELIYLWGDLAAAYRYSRATPPEASGGCENAIHRIHSITKLIGPVPVEHIEMPFLLTGMYEKVHAQIGIEVTVPEDLLQQARDREAEARGER